MIRLPIVKHRHETFGRRAPNCGPAIFHGRTSTNDKGLLNCHPMISEDWALIHNGVVTDHGPKYAMKTTNDSEHVLHRLIQGIGEVEAHLSGYYAFAAIDQDGKLHIARDAQASLFFAWSDKLDTYIFATTESLLRDVNKVLKAKIGPIEELKDNCYCVFNGNAIEHQQEIKPRGYSQYESSLAHLSLGRNISSAPYSYAETYHANASADALDYERPVQWYERESDYETYKREVYNMDASYTIEDAEGRLITLQDFRLLTEYEQECCTIMRANGTIVEPCYGRDSTDDVA